MSAAERDAAAHLRDLIAAIEAHRSALDSEMRTRPNNAEREARVAKLANALELRKDTIAKRYGLGK